MIAILSDVHGNLPALKAVLKDAIQRGCRRFISLGDVAGYCAQPGECIDLMKEYNVVHIMGNHDSYLIFDKNCPRSKVVSQIIEYQKKIIGKTQLEWLKKSPAFLVDGSCMYVHGGPIDPQDQYLYSVEYKTIPENVVYLFVGHTHVQKMACLKNKTFCNPGSVGQPRDGDKRAAYAIFDGKAVFLQRIDYDISKTIEAMKFAGFESFCYENLFYGTQIGGRIDRIEILENGES